MVDQTGSEESISIAVLTSGDKEEFSKLVERYSDPIYRIGLRMTGDIQEAEEIVQTTFIKAMNSIQSFEGRSMISTWLYRIAMNEALMLLRERRSNIISTEENEDENGEPKSLQIVDWCCLPEEELLGGESRKFLDQAIGELSQSLRAVFILRDIEGLSIKETAATLHLTETNVKTRLSRARFKLRELLSNYFGERLSN